MTTFWQEVLARPRDVYAKLSKAQRTGVLALASIGIVVAVLASLLAGRESFGLLYGGLEPAAAQEVCSKLTEMGVPYHLTPDGTGVQVPEEKVPEIKAQLAGAGLPKLGSRGYELFDENQLALTDSLFNINVQRATMGELEKCLETYGPVKRAHVLVNIAPPVVIQRGSARTTAAVTLELRPGMPLAEGEVAAMVHLVATAVGHAIQLQDITITDSDMRLLHPRGDDDGTMASFSNLQKAQSYGQTLAQKAESQLAFLGLNKASVRVNVELDMTHKETSSEKVDPRSKAPIKESKSSENRPGSGNSAPVETSKDEETEYQNSVDRSLTIVGAGAIRRLSVSVLLDESLLTKPDANGQPGPVDMAKKTEIEKLVKSAVGFVATRDNGATDDFQIVLAKFATPPEAAKAPGPFALENLLPLAGHLAEAVTVLFVLIFLVRTLKSGGFIRAKSKGAPAAAAAGISSTLAAADGTPIQDDMLELEMGEGQGPDLRTRLGRFVDHHPDQAREVLLTWLRDEAAA